MGSDRLERRAKAATRRAARLATREQTATDYRPYRTEPGRFAREVLGITSATRRSDRSPYQDDILAAVLTSPRTAIVSGHGVGKTLALACLALWWLLSRPFSRVILCAPQLTRQVRHVLFGEVRKLVRLARQRGHDLPVEVFADRITVTGHGPEWSALGIPATEPDRIEGQHAEGGLLLLLDETKGIPQDTVDALMGALTSGEDSRLVVASTPGGCAGPFYRAVTDPRGRWTVHRIPSTDSSLVSPQWVRDRREEWGEESPLYRSRVLGEFADAGDGTLYPLALLEAASVRQLVTEGDPLSVGVDVARSLGGDLNCVAVAQGGRLLRVVTWRSPDLMATVNRVLAEVTTLPARPSRVVVDETGVGAGVADRLKQLGLPVVGFAFGGSASDPSRFKNRRAELFFSLRERLEQGECGLLDEDDLLADLAGLVYHFDPAGRIVLDSKDELRRRLGRSPDRADAVALALGRSERALPPLQRGHFSVYPGGCLVTFGGRMGHSQAWPSPFAVSNEPPPTRPAA